MDEELTQLNLKLFRKWKLEADREWIGSWPPSYWPPGWRGENSTWDDGISNGTIAKDESDCTEGGQKDGEQFDD